MSFYKRFKFGISTKFIYSSKNNYNNLGGGETQNHQLSARSLTRLVITVFSNLTYYQRVCRSNLKECDLFIEHWVLFIFNEKRSDKI